MSLEIDGLVGHEGVGRAVSLVEGIGRKLLHHPPELLHLGPRVAAGSGFPEKLFPERIGSRPVPPALEAPPKEIPLLRRHPRRPLGDLHDLFLVEEDAARFGQDPGQERIAVGPPALLPDAEDALLHPAFRRPGPDQSQGLGQVLDVAGFHPAEKIHHGRAFDLEAADRPGFLEEAVGRRVAGGKVAEAEAGFRLGNGRQAADRQEVELDELKVLDRVPIVVGHEDALGRMFQRKMAVGRGGGEDDAPDVEGDLVVNAGQLGGRLPDVQASGRSGVFFHVLRRFIIRRPPAQRPGLRRRQAERPGGLVEGRAGAVAFQGADEGRPGPAPAVALEDIGEDPVAAAGVEVKIEVGRIGPSAVEEALEIEVEGHRVDVGDAQQPGQERRGPRALEVVENAVFAGEGNDVVDDQEVRAETRALDDGQLPEGPLALGPAQIPRPPKAGHDLIAKAEGKQVGRERRDDVPEIEPAFPGDFVRPEEGGLYLGPESLPGQGFLLRAEAADRPAELLPGRGKRGLFLEGVEEDEPLGGPDVLQRTGPDERKAVDLGRGPGRGRVEEIHPDIEVGRRRAGPQR